MKRYLRYLALVSALALVLAACGDGEGGDTTTPAGRGHPTAETTTTAGGETTTSAAGESTTTGGGDGLPPVKACFVTDGWVSTTGASSVRMAGGSGRCGKWRGTTRPHPVGVVE